MATNPNARTGVAIVLPVPASIAASLALPGGESAEELHVTLIYVGDLASLPEGGATALVDAMRVVAALRAPIDATLGGIGRFSGDEIDAVHLTVDAPALVALRVAVVEAIAAAGITLDASHGFDPHLTLAYIAKDAAMPIERVEPSNVVFDRIAVWAGEERTSFRLAGSSTEMLDACPPGTFEMLDARPIGDQIPTELRLFVWGVNDTVKGRFFLDEAGADALLARFTDHGIKPPVDFDHNTFTETAQKKDTAGRYSTIEKRVDGLWAAQVQWTQIGLEAISSGRAPDGSKTIPEYCYWSPSVMSVPGGPDGTRRIIGTGPLAITTYPATKGQQPMTLNANATRVSRDLRVTMLDAMSFDDVRSAACRALDTLPFKDSWIVELYDDSLVFQVGSQLFQISYRMDGSAVVLIGNPVKVQRQYTPVEDPMKTVLNALGLKADATESDVLAAVMALKGEKAEFLRAVDAQNDTVALGAVEVLKAASAEVPVLKAKVTELTETLTAKDRERLIAKGVEEGRFTPDTVKRCAKKSVEEVTELLSLMPVQPALLAANRKTEPNANGGGKGPPGRIVDPQGRTYEKLSNAERELLSNTDRHLFDEMRADWQHSTTR